MTAMESSVMGQHVQPLLRRLAEPGSSSPVLTMYVNLDPRLYPTLPDRTDAVRGVMASAARNAPSGRWRQVLTELGRDMGLTGYELDDAQGMLITGKLDEDAISVVKLPRPVASSVSYDSSVHLRTLLERESTIRWCVALVNRRTARVLLGTAADLREHTRFDDAVEGRHHQGGWAQKRFERAIDRHADDHLRRLARELSWLQRSDGFDELLIAAPKEMHGRVEELLPRPVRDRLVSWVSVDVDDSSPQMVLEVAERAMRRHELGLRDALMRQAVEHIGRRSRGAHGVDAVLDALNNQQVDTLLVSRSLAVNGMSCDACGWMAPVGERCMRDGSPLHWRRDIIEHAVAAAIRQDADVVMVGEPEDPDDDGTSFARLEQLGGIAAILRYDLAGPTAGR